MDHDVRPYLSARTTSAPTVAPDGRLAFLADLTGTTQVWTLEDARAWPTQRTFYDERVSFVSWSPTGEALAFGKDAGADEHDQLYRLDPESGAIDPLTNRPDAIHAWGGWSPDGERIAFAANRRDPSTFDVHVMDGEGGESRLVCEGGADDAAGGDGRLDVEGWSPDGDRLLVRTPRASSDDDLSTVDVASGERTHLTPHEGHVRYRHPTFGPDGKAVYCVSDARADTLELVRIDLEGEVETVAGGEWSVDEFVLDRESGRVALSRNVDGYSSLEVGEFAAPTDLSTVGVDLPADGVVRDLAIGFGGRIAVGVSAPDLNRSAFVVDGSNELERWTRPSAGGVPLEAYRSPELIRYETFDGKEIPAYVAFPDDVDPDDEASVPVIVDVHGGPHHQRRPWFRPVRQYFLDAGYAIFEPNVRGSSGYGAEYAALDDVEKRMDSVRDLAAAVDWLRDRPAVDPDRIVAYGRSYGGFMVLSAITEYPELWAAAVDFVGIANWITFLENTGDWRRSHREAEYGSLEEDREFLESISPIHAVDEISCPLFVQHGENDPRVPVGEARQIVEEVGARGVPVESLIFDDEGHHITKLENRLEAFERIAAFLDEHVGADR